MSSLFGVLFFAFVSTGQGNTDLVTCLQPADYFQARQIDVSIDKMMELAATEPKDAKTQVMQLTALRYLTDESDALKKSAKYTAHRQSLEQIALGKKAHDSLGFSKDYAGWLLAKLDGTKIKPGKAPLLREDAAAWFPAETTFLVASDCRQVSQFGTAAPGLKEVLKLIPEEGKMKLYEMVEKAGNIRLEQLSFGFVDHQNRDQQKIMVRVTGKANQVWLADMLKSMPHSRFETREIKDSQGTPIILLQEPNRAPIFALVGNTDLLILGYVKDGGKHEEILDAVLAVREKKKANAATGPLKTLLPKVPVGAIGLIAGELPKEMEREFRFLNAMPTRILGHVTRDIQGLDVQLEATMKNAGDADAFVGKISALRKEGIEELKKAQERPLPPGLPPVPFASLINVLDSLQVQSKTDKVQMRMEIPEALLQQAPAFFLLAGI